MFDVAEAMFKSILSTCARLSVDIQALERRIQKLEGSKDPGFEIKTVPDDKACVRCGAYTNSVYCSSKCERGEGPGGR